MVKISLSFLVVFALTVIPLIIQLVRGELDATSPPTVVEMILAIVFLAISIDGFKRFAVMKKEEEDG